MKKRHCVVLLTVLINSYIIGYLTRTDVTNMLTDVLLPFGGALTGIILATIGIIMGSVGSIYTAVASRSTVTNANHVKQSLDKLDEMVTELKHDCILVVIGFGVLLATYVASKLDIPGVSLPVCRWCCKATILQSLAVFVVALSFWAIYDTVIAVFALHKHGAQLARDEK